MDKKLFLYAHNQRPCVAICRNHPPQLAVRALQRAVGDPPQRRQADLAREASVRAGAPARAAALPQTPVRRGSLPSLGQRPVPPPQCSANLMPYINGNPGDNGIASAVLGDHSRGLCLPSVPLSCSFSSVHHCPWRDRVFVGIMDTCSHAKAALPRGHHHAASDRSLVMNFSRKHSHAPLPPQRLLGGFVLSKLSQGGGRM